MDDGIRPGDRGAHRRCVAHVADDVLDAVDAGGHAIEAHDLGTAVTEQRDRRPTDQARTAGHDDAGRADVADGHATACGVGCSASVGVFDRRMRGHPFALWSRATAMTTTEPVTICS